MKFKSTLIMATVLLGIGMYVYYIDIPRTEKAKTEKERAEKIIPFEKEDVEEFTISYADTTITMKLNKDKGWNMARPVTAKGDKKNADGIVSRLNAATFSRIVDEKPENLKTYGLDEPELTISLKIKGEEKKEIIVGDTAPLGNGVYVKRKWDTKIFLAGAYVRDDLKKNVYDLRNKNVIDIDKEDVEEIQLKSNDRLIAAARAQDGWNVSKPIQTDGDEDEINKLINNIKNLKVKEFIAEEADDLAQYGLDVPQSSVEILTGKDKASRTLLIGKRHKDGYYAKRSSAKNIFLLKADDLKNITEKDIYELRDKNIFKFDKDDIKKIELKYPDERIVLKKGEKKGYRDLWEILQPINTKGNEVEISRLLNSLEGMKVKKFISGDDKGLKEYEFDRPKIQISLWGKDDKSAGSLTIGRPEKKRDGYISKTARIESIFLTDADDVDDISKKLFDLRDRRLISFEEEMVNKIRLKYTDRTFLVEKESGKWKVVEPEKTTANETKVRMFLWNLRDVEFKKIVSSSSDEAEQYGLIKPSLEISIWQKDVKDVKKLIIGDSSESKDFLYAQNNVSSQIYGIDTEVLKKFPKEIDEF